MTKPVAVSLINGAGGFLVGDGRHELAWFIG